MPFKRLGGADRIRVYQTGHFRDGGRTSSLTAAHAYLTKRDPWSVQPAVPVRAVEFSGEPSRIELHGRTRSSPIGNASMPRIRDAPSIPTEATYSVPNVHSTKSNPYKTLGGHDNSIEATNESPGIVRMLDTQTRTR